VLHFKSNKPDRHTGVTYTLSKNRFLQLIQDPSDLSGIQVDGDGMTFARLVALFDRHNRIWNIVLPLSYDNSRSNRVNRVTLAARLSESVFVVSVAGISGCEYRLNSSTNLTHWQIVATNTSPFSVTNQVTPDAPHTFFRATD
jgi:hypothetical protein